MTTLPFRQVHLDFHTSPHISEVGANLDPEDFAATLEKAWVNSVTVFARCHHGLIYYDSGRNPERVHPGLKNKNLLKEQIEACHKRGIRAPIYTTVQWDDFTADAQRNWLLIDEEGREYGTPPLQPGFYRFLDVFHPGYRDFLREHVRELLTTLPVDGFFFDIVQPRPSLARHWLDAMDDAGLNPEDEEARHLFARNVIDDWKLEMSDFVWDIKKDCTVFYNAGHVGPRHRPTVRAYSHYELESLPSGGWGYTHFPLSMRYARKLGRDCLGMTGKFHTSWGDFHSYKNRAALEFECFTMLALGAKCSVGDQLHPKGKLDPYTYDLIGSVYEQVEGKEPWCQGAQGVSEIAVLTPEAFQSPLNSERQSAAATGAVRMLQELKLQFDLVSPEMGLNPYPLLILPDKISVDEALAAKLQDYLAGGGAIIASYEAGLTPDGGGFALDAFGVTLKGPAPFSPDFIVPGEALGHDLPPTGHVMYLQGLEVEPREDAEVLAQVELPYFNRTWRHFCSHRHTPSSGEIGYPGIVRMGSCLYFAHPIFTQYAGNAPRWCKTLLDNAVRLLLPERLLETDAPSTLQATLNHQPHENRYVLHLLHYLPERRGQAFDVLEDVIPLYNVQVSVNLPQVKGVRLVVEGIELDFTARDGRVSFSVPELRGHGMVELLTR